MMRQIVIMWDLVLRRELVIGRLEIKVFLESIINSRRLRNIFLEILFIKNDVRMCHLCKQFFLLSTPAIEKNCFGASGIKSALRVQTIFSYYQLRRLRKIVWPFSNHFDRKKPFSGSFWAVFGPKWPEIRPLGPNNFFLLSTPAIEKNCFGSSGINSALRRQTIHFYYQLRRLRKIVWALWESKPHSGRKQFIPIIDFRNELFEKWI